MRKKIYKIDSIILIITLTFSFSQLLSQSFYPVTKLDNPSPGYILTGPLGGTTLSLHDNSGKAVFSKDVSSYGINPNAFRVLEDGNLAFFSSLSWVVMDRTMNVIDVVTATSEYATDFHTFSVSPEGHYLLVGREFVTVDMSQKVEGGKTYARVLNIIIQELDRQKNLVFQWNAYEHIDVLSTTEDQSLTLSEIDPYHINTAKYDYDGNIIANFRNLDAVIKINRSNGQIMWIWGGSKCKINQFTFTNDTRNGFTGFSHQHDPKRLPNGNFLLFDNAVLNPSKSSRAVEYSINEQTKTATKVWEYEHSPAIFAEFQGNAQRLSNGNTMIGWGVNYTGNLCTEVTSDKKIVAEMGLGGNTYSYQVLRYPIMMNAVTNNIYFPRTYSFNDGTNNTSISLNVTSITGGGSVSVEKHDYAPWSISYETTRACNYLPYRWVVSYRNITNFKAQLFLSLNQISTVQDKKDLVIFWRDKENSGNFRQLNTKYNPESDRLEADITGTGEFFIGFTSNNPPTLLYPSNGSQDIPVSSILHWNDNNQIHNFIVQLATDQNFSNILINKLLSEKTSLSFDSLKYNTKYYWRVKANDNECDAKWSNIYTFTTEIAKPELLLPDNHTTNQALDGELKWKCVSGAVRYEIVVTEDKDFKDSAFTFNLNTDTCVMKYRNLKPYTDYYWRVAPIKDAVIKNWSETFTFKTTPGKVILSSPENYLNRNTINGKLTWQPINSVKDWEIQISADSNFIQGKSYSYKISGNNEFDYNNLDYSTTYYWRVKGIFKDTCTQWSDVWQFTTKIAPPEKLLTTKKVLLSSNLNKEFIYSSTTDTITSGFDIQGLLLWNDVKNAERYQIQLSLDTGFYLIKYNQFCDKTNIYYDNLYYSTTYWCRIRSFDGEQYSDWSQLMEFKTIDDLLVPQNNHYKIPVNANLLWNPTKDALYYEVRIAKDTEFNNEVKYYNSSNNNYFKVEGLDNNTKYYWSVRYFKNNQFSNWSQVFSFTTQLQKPTLQSPVEIETNNTTDLPFTWLPGKDNEYFKLQLASDKDFNNIKFEIDKILSDNFILHDNLEDGNYFWRVAGFNELNSSQWSEISSFVVNSAMSVENYTSTIEISNYPNPVKNETIFNLISNENMLLTLKIYNSNSQLVDTPVNSIYEAGTYKIRWDANKFNQGIYYYVLTADKITKSGILTIIR
jgi:hypothetical protein